MLRKDPIVVGKIYHVYSRGVAKGAICEGESDSWRFLQGLVLFNDTKSAANILWRLQRNRGRLTMNVLKEYIVSDDGEREPLVRIMAYCIMGNHYHLLVEEIQEGGITKFMRKLGTGYARYFNNKYERVGPLFQSRFKNVLVDDERYLQYLLVYINVLNPAGIIEPNWKEQGIQDVEKVLKFTEEYQWSSHADYQGKRGSLILDRGILGELLPTPRAYTALVRVVLEAKKYAEIEHLTLE
ncbi:MAG: hypothetical protein Greene071421_88 [Parcubacteria group bacterium Greene0714_21]|nr:MAG: hypothetical protein Greene041639_539 [Parcubacteria group bacterium Greene0416_39]TSC97778.1 MAG: hypothetical protein Greene101447_314 [Parcubacteria group bacterium Greene1014_47]TSD04252.1 MAG: hypothetical protein Greene071421_88 [Parcubacteria group bacterium Greene0714_21]